MKDYLGEDFLLPNEAARRLYHDHAAHEPIVDYHCHLPPADIALDSRYADLAQAWLGGDHYKWRAMRANGVPEADITGHPADRRTFEAWAATLPRLVGNPLHHWAHLELRRYFGWKDLLGPATAASAWEACNARLASPGFGARGLLRKMKVKAVCTTDDPADSLEHHLSYAKARAASDPALGEPLMLPAFRPDKALALEDPLAWKAYLARLGSSAGVEITSYAKLVEALEKRHAFFHEAGCRLSDHALLKPVARSATASVLEATFGSALAGRRPVAEDLESIKTALLLEVGRMNARRGWTMQLHMAAARNLNARMFARLGPDTGYDAIGDSIGAEALGAFLDALDSGGNLPKIVLYSNNPNDYEVISTVMGCFQDGTAAGKMQLGSAWWFNDHIDGMRRQLSVLASTGLLSRFVGMLTDSRSFLSFPRHEYFRRILAGMVGTWMEEGLAPGDHAAMGALVRDISYRNARDFFALPGLGA